MSRNGSGTYNLPAGNPVVTGTTISTTWANTTLTDIGSALTGSVASDGQTPMTGSLNMNSNAIANLANPTANQDAATKVYVDTNALLKANNLSDVANATTSRTNLSAAKSGANSDITSITGLTTPLTVAQGGIGAATLTANNVLLGNGTSAVQVVAPSTSGNVLTSNGTTWTSAAPAYVGNRGQVFTSSGTFTVPAGITAVKVTVIGGGGGGLTTTTGAGGGGGGGGVAIRYVTGLTPSGTVSVTVGGGGGASTAGGTSSFGSSASATGGGFGVGGAGGTGGSGSSGDINLTGGAGGTGAVDGDGTSSGGGGAAGGGNGANGYAVFPTLKVAGGGGEFGGGGNGVDGFNNSSNGNNGRGYGSGGSGAVGTATGGSGTAGIVIVEW